MMKAKPVKFEKGNQVDVPPEQATHVILHLPGPQGQFLLPITTQRAAKTPGRWFWNGNMEMPSIDPSIKSECGHFAKSFDPTKDSCWCTYNKQHPDDQHFHCYICHSCINDGKVAFQGDCSHEFRGKTVDLLDII